MKEKDTHQDGTSLLHETIASAARELWEEAGRPSGRDDEFWFRAEAQVCRPGRGRAGPSNLSMQGGARTPALRPAPASKPSAAPPMPGASAEAQTTRRKTSRAGH